MIILRKCNIQIQTNNKILKLPKMSSQQHHKDAQKQQHEQKQSQQQPKQMRRVAERQQMPTDKTELIQYLSSRIKQAEDALLDTEELLEQEIKERQKISKSLDLRNQQLQKLCQVDQRALPEKIKQKLNEILTMTVTQKIESEELLLEQKNKNYQYKSRYDELKWEDANNKIKLQEQSKKEQELNKILEKLDNANKDHEEQLANLQTQYNSIRQNKEMLQNKYLQMRVALERMSDIKGVLNRFFSNEDLFDEKMELKEQKVQRLPQPAKETQLPPSRQSRGTKANNQARLKPITLKPKNEDEDFWKADFKGKNAPF